MQINLSDARVDRLRRAMQERNVAHGGAPGNPTSAEMISQLESIIDHGIRHIQDAAAKFKIDVQLAAQRSERGNP